MGCGTVGSPTDVNRGKRRTVAPSDRQLTVGRGVALPLSVPLPSLGRQQSGGQWRRAVHGGRGPPYHSGSRPPGFSGHDLRGAPVRRRGPPCSSRPPFEPAAGAGGRVTLRLPSLAGGVHPDSPPSGRAVGGGGAQNPKRPTRRSKAPPRGRPAAAPTTRSQVGGNRDRTAPPQTHQTEHRTGAGHTEGHGPRGTALPAPSAGTTRDARATPPSGERTPRERERTHTKSTRGDNRKGNRTERAETHRPHGMAYQRARVRGTRTGRPATRSAEHAGGKGEEGETQHQAPARTPPNRPRAPRTHGRATAPAKAVVAHSATPQPLG